MTYVSEDDRDDIATILSRAANQHFGNPDIIVIAKNATQFKVAGLGDQAPTTREQAFIQESLQALTPRQTGFTPIILKAVKAMAITL